jgi:iron complex transport system ATP-binding protein
VSINVQGLSVHYGTRIVLQDINLYAGAGRVLGIVGPNGSGKSTLIKAVAGLLKASGRIHFSGREARPKSVGYMPQDLQAPMALTVIEVVLLGRIAQLRLRVSAEDLEAVRQVLHLLGLEALAGRYLSELSGGQRQMVFLAQALVSQPTVLLLDEPISALDICHQLEVLEVVRAMTLERGLCTLMVLHDLNAAARFADDVALLREGCLVACGDPVDVLSVENIATGFDVEAEALTCLDGTGVLIPRRPVRMLTVA